MDLVGSTQWRLLVASKTSMQGPFYRVHVWKGPRSDLIDRGRHGKALLKTLKGPFFKKKKDISVFQQGMDSYGFKHLSGCSVGRDEHCTFPEMFSESWKNKLQENAFDHIWDLVQKITEIHKVQNSRF